jgi:hypothetical protein
MRRIYLLITFIVPITSVETVENNCPQFLNMTNTQGKWVNQDMKMETPYENKTIGEKFHPGITMEVNESMDPQNQMDEGKENYNVNIKKSPYIPYTFGSFCNGSQYHQYYSKSNDCLIKDWDKAIILQMIKPHLTLLEYEKFIYLTDLLEEKDIYKKENLVGQCEKLESLFKKSSNKFQKKISLVKKFQNLLTLFTKDNLPKYLTFQILFFELVFWDADVEMSCQINTANKIFVIYKDSNQRLPLMFLNKLTNTIIDPVQYAEKPLEKGPVPLNYAIDTTKLHQLLAIHPNKNQMTLELKTLFSNPINPVLLAQWKDFNETKVEKYFPQGSKNFMAENNIIFQIIKPVIQQKIPVKDEDIINTQCFVTTNAVDLKYKRILINQMLLCLFLNKINPCLWSDEKINHKNISITEEVFITLKNNDHHRNSYKILYYNDKHISKEDDDYYDYGLENTSENSDDSNEEMEYNMIFDDHYYNQLMEESILNTTLPIPKKPGFSLGYLFDEIIAVFPLPNIKNLRDLYDFHPRKFIFLQQLQHKRFYDVIFHNYERSGLAINPINKSQILLGQIKDLVNLSTIFMGVNKASDCPSAKKQMLQKNSLWLFQQIMEFLFPWKFLEHDIRVLINKPKKPVTKKIFS